jgi:hypothetical protein
MKSSMRRAILPLALAATAIFGAGCGAPEVEGRNPEDAKKFETPADEKKADEQKSDAGVKPTETDAKTTSDATPRGTPKDETTGIAPVTPPPAGGGKPTGEQPKVGG